MTLEELIQEAKAADEHSRNTTRAYVDAVLSGASISRKMELEQEAWKALGAASALMRLLERYY